MQQKIYVAAVSAAENKMLQSEWRSAAENEMLQSEWRIGCAEIGVAGLKKPVSAMGGGLGK
jgi:hypothetical protein